LCTSRFIGEPLVDHTGQQFISTVDIVHAVRGALAVAEIKLRQIAMKVLLNSPLVEAYFPEQPHPPAVY